MIADDDGEILMLMKYMDTRGNAKGHFGPNCGFWIMWSKLQFGAFESDRTTYPTRPKGSLWAHVTHQRSRSREHRSIKSRVMARSRSDSGRTVAGEIDGTGCCK